MQQSKIQSILFLIFVMLCQHTFSQYITYCQKGKWGFATIDGKITIPCTYEEVDFYSDDSLAKVKKAGKYGYIDRKEITVIPLEYDECYRIYEVYHGKHTIGIKNNPKIHLNSDFSFSDIRNSRYIVSKNNKYGILNLVEGKPNVFVPLNYSNIQFDPRKKIFHCTSGNSTQFFNTNGEKLTKEQEANIGNPEYATIYGGGGGEKPVVTKFNGKVGVILQSHYFETKSDTLVPIIYDEIITDNFDDDDYFPDNDIFAVRLGKKWGIAGNRKNMLLPIKYDSVNFELSKESRDWAEYQRIFVVKKNNQWGIIGKRNDNAELFTTFLPFEYQSISKIYYDFLLVQKENKFQVFSIETYRLISDKSYSSITKYEYESVNGFELFQVTNKPGQTVYLGKNGVEFFTD